VSRLTRLAALAAASAAVLAGSVSAFAALGVGLAHGAASASIPPLAPLVDASLAGSTVYADDGTTVLAVLKDSQTRLPVALDQVSKTMITAVLDTEDHRFYTHGGFDIPSIVRAFAADSSGSSLQGGSTIAQQLVKQTYLSSERKLSRKIKEAVLADRLERQYSKNQILQAYLNTIYLGNGAYGVEAAANTYFGEHAGQLTLPQAALLAGLIQNPNGYDPLLKPSEARTRRAEVLARMRVYGDITAAEESEADAAPLPTSLVEPAVTADGVSDYYVREVKNELLAPNSPLGGTYAQRYQELFEGGLKIYTDLDPSTQAAAERAVSADTPANNRGFDQAMVAIDPATGKVRAMVGGPSLDQEHFNIVTQGTRQPGSGFKIFTLLAALEKGYSIFDTLDGQSPCAIDFPTDHDLVTHPANNDEGNGGGILTLLNATAQSTNCAFIRLAHEVGLSNVISMAQRLGITAHLEPYPSIVIGSIAVHPIEMAAAYAAVADDGVYHAPSFIDHVVDRSGKTIYTGGDPGHRVVSAQIAEEATVAFQAVVQNGTGTAAAIAGRPVAGKTGTTNQNVDGWFNGFTPQLEATVWMGNPSAEVPMINVAGVPQVYGGTFPARTWHDMMAAALANQPPLPFVPPDMTQLPPPVYITSPGLVRDDVLDHNNGGVSTTPYPAPTPSPAPSPYPAPAPAPSPTSGGRGRHG
jgi:membrane peptidoglycan carboxypeptidase